MNVLQVGLASMVLFFIIMAIWLRSDSEREATRGKDERS